MTAVKKKVVFHDFSGTIDTLTLRQYRMPARLESFRYPHLGPVPHKIATLVCVPVKQSILVIVAPHSLWYDWYLRFLWYLRFPWFRLRPNAVVKHHASQE
jgi:hypothetical protein